LLSGHDGSVTGRDFASIFGAKENSTSGNYASYLAFGTRANGGAVGERLRITSDGKLGLGTSAPTSLLTVGSGSTANPAADVTIQDSTVDQYRLKLTSNNYNVDTKWLGIGFGFNNNYLKAGILAEAKDGNARTNLHFCLDGTATSANADLSDSKMVITYGGNVGVGTTNPATLLEVSRTGSGLVGSFNDGTYGLDIAATASGGSIQTSNLNQTLDLKTFGTSSNSINFLVGNSERARIDSSGRLLVGTTSTSSNTLAVIEGSSSADTGPGILYLARGSNSPLDGYGIGELYFTDSGHATSTRSAASVTCARDGGTWTSGSSMPGRLVFSTTADGASSPTERMRIPSTGNILTYSDQNAQIKSGNTGTTLRAFSISSGATSVTTGSLVFQVMADGDCENNNNSYGAISDIKLKENIVDANSQWDDLKALQVRKYNFKVETGYNTHTQIGLIAQEVELVSPGLVGESINEETGESTKSVNYSVLYMKAVKALQEAMERIEVLEQRLSNAGIA